MSRRKSMPDVAEQPFEGPESTLDWVGMSQIEMPIRLENTQGETNQSLAQIQAFVNLSDPQAKGIHMSRLYVTLDQKLSAHTLTPQLLREVLQDFARTHRGRSTKAKVQITSQCFLRRQSLISDNSGWRNYPIFIEATYSETGIDLDLAVDITYSSTCPCSAALARQLIQEKFRQDFANQSQIDRETLTQWLGQSENIVGTPHSQRSVAQIKIRLSEDSKTFPIQSLIDLAEDALQTAVLATVKREDEQEFSRLNGQNLMFCEDAARRLKKALYQCKLAEDYWIRVDHFESLHPHNATAIVTKGTEGGFKPLLNK